MIIVVGSSKGGVGKTTTTINLLAGLARRGKKVIGVDLDPQGHLSKYMAMPEEAGTYEMLINGAHPGELLRPIPPEQWAEDEEHATGKLAILPGNLRTSTAAHALAAEGKPSGYLRKCLAPLAKGADVVVLDTSPTVTTLMVQIYFAADLVLVPTQAELLSMHGINQVMDRIAETQAISQEYNLGLRCALMGIIPMMIRARTKEHQTNLDDLHTIYPDLVWDVFPQSTLWPETVAYGKSIFAFAPDSKEAWCAERFVNRFQQEAAAMMGQVSR